MPKKKVAKIDMIKAIGGISFTTLAAVGGATGNPLFAGLAAIPAAGLAVHSSLEGRLAELMLQKEGHLEIPPPSWWTLDMRNWQSLCTRVAKHLPQLLQTMQERMLQEEQVMTRDRIRQIFIETFALLQLSREQDIEQRRRIGEFLASPILEKINEVLQPLSEQIQQEGFLIDERRTAQYTKQTVQMLEQIHEQVKGIAKPHILNDEAIATLHKHYCEDLYKHWRMLDFKGIMRVDMNRPISIPLNEVFILPDVLSGVPEYETLEREAEEFQYGSRARKAKLVPPQREPLLVVLAKYRRLVLLGDPGSGKSTLLRYLLLQFVQGSDTFAAIFPENISATASIVPVYMPLAAFAESLLTGTPGTRSLEGFLPIYLRDHYLGAYVDFVQMQLERGMLALLFDGLDEIPDAALRVQVVRHIESFTHAHAENRFLVTSRIVGYKEVSLSSEYQPYTLADFNEEQIKAFTQRWCPAYERWVKGTWESQSLEDAATKEAEKLFQATQSKPTVRRLAVNPLLLTILALIQRQGIELPSHRVELFDLCAATLIDTWVKARGQSIQLSKNALIKILRPLAFWMHQHPSVGNIPEEDLYEQIVQQLIERSISEYEATKLAEQFLETVRGKTGILVERGKQRYGFLHLTFEEYFAARELEQRKDRNDFIRKHLHDPRWHEVILLTVGAIGILQNNEEEVTELIYHTITRAGSPYEWALHRDLLFAGECLADDIGIRVDRENDIIEHIVYHTLTSPYDGLQKACSKVLARWSETGIGEKATSLILPLLHQWVTAPDSKKTSVATARLEERLQEYIEDLAAIYQEEMKRHLYFQLTIILARLQALERVDWIGNLVGILSEEHERARALSIYKDRSSQLSPVEVLLDLLSDGDASVRKKVVSALGHLGDPSSGVIDALLITLSDFDLEVRRVAITALGRLGVKQPRIIKALLATLNEQPYLKQATIDALCKLDPDHTETIEAMLVSLIDIDSQWIRQKASDVLKGLNNQKHTPDMLFTCLSDPTVDLRETVAHVVGQLGSKPDDMVDRIYQLLDSSTIAREVVFRALGYLAKGQPQVIHTLLSYLDETSVNNKIAVIRALGQCSGEQPQIVNALVSLLSHSSYLIRYAGIKALEQSGNGEAHVTHALLSALSDPYAYVREAAIEALGQLNQTQPCVLTALFSALSDSDDGVRVSAATVLGRIGQIQSPLLETLASALTGFDETTTDRAVDALIQFCANQPDRTDHIVSALSDSSVISLLQETINIYKKSIYSRFIERIASILGDVTTTRNVVIDLLFIAISDKDFYIKREVARALGKIGKKETTIVEKLLEILSGESEDASASAAEALGQLEKAQPHVINILLSALPNFSERVRANAIQTLGKLGKGYPSVLDNLLQALFDPDWGYVRQNAAASLRQIDEGKPDVLNALLQALCGQSWWGANGASMALGELGKEQPTIIDALLSLLSSSNALTREMAAYALGDLDDKRPDLVEVLLPLIADPHWSVRKEIARALGKLDDKLLQSFNVLYRALSDSSPSVRHNAAYALRNGDGEDSRVTSALLSALSDIDWDVRGAAAYSLATLQNDISTIGTRIDDLLRQHEHIARRDLRDYGLLFNALHEVAQKGYKSI